jgi:hypothetical protein
MVSHNTPPFSRIIVFAALAICLACVLYRFVVEGTFAYVAADWRRALLVTIVILVGTITVVVAQRQAVLMRRTSHAAHSPPALFRPLQSVAVGDHRLFLLRIWLQLLAENFNMRSNHNS